MHDAVESDLIVKELSTSRKKHKPWWNPSLTELRKVARQARIKWKSNKFDVQLKSNYLGAQRILISRSVELKELFTVLNTIS